MGISQPLNNKFIIFSQYLFISQDLKVTNNPTQCSLLSSPSSTAATAVAPARPHALAARTALARTALYIRRTKSLVSLEAQRRLRRSGVKSEGHRVVTMLQYTNGSGMAMIRDNEEMHSLV